MTEDIVFARAGHGRPKGKEETISPAQLAVVDVDTGCAAIS